MPRNQAAFLHFSVQFFEHFNKNLTVAVHLICQIDEAGKLQERNGNTVVAVIWGRPFQAHHFGLGLNMGSDQGGSEEPEG